MYSFIEKLSTAKANYKSVFHVMNIINSFLSMLVITGAAFFAVSSKANFDNTD